MIHDAFVKHHAPDEVIQGHRVNVKVSMWDKLNVDVA